MATQPDWFTRERDHGQSGPGPFGSHEHGHSRDDSSMMGQVSHLASHVMDSGYTRTLALAGLVAGLGIAIGFWLGGRREEKRQQSTLKQIDMPDMVKLTPVVAQLMANPVVRVYAARLVWRQMRKYLDTKLDR